MTMPNFLIIGAAKSGTTSLHQYLKQHPQIYVSPQKEPEFFALDGRDLNFSGPEGREPVTRRIQRECATNIEKYRALFDGASGEMAIGEASPWYLYSAQAPNRIKHYIPEVRLIAILRNPVERAYSLFTYHRMRGYEPLSDFSQALRAEDDRKRNNWEWWWYYKDHGFYYAQLKRYFDAFDQDQIRVYLYEDLESDRVRFAQSVYRFLAVDDSVVPDVSLRYNMSGVPKNKLLSSLVDRRDHPVKTVLRPLLPAGLRKRLSTSVKNRNLVKPPPLAPEIRRELIEVYRDDIVKLEGLIGRDLSAWLQ